jgi:multimeric flavodoxin WrbA
LKTVLIREFEFENIPNSYTLDLEQKRVKNCIGCWSCWWKTPGRCSFKDLDEFYHQYITADKAIYLCQVTKGFVSGNLKSLFDRMIPLYLPYVSYTTGESMHVPRYEKYPDVEFYYKGQFQTENGRQIFEDYIHRVFYQFHSKNVSVKPVEEFVIKEGISK